MRLPVMLTPLLYGAVDWDRSVAPVSVPIAIWMVIAANFPAGFLRRFKQYPML
jgi:hypothetical protein